MRCPLHRYNCKGLPSYRNLGEKKFFFTNSRAGPLTDRTDKKIVLITGKPSGLEVTVPRERVSIVGGCIPVPKSRDPKRNVILFLSLLLLFLSAPDGILQRKKKMNEGRVGRHAVVPGRND